MASKEDSDNTIFCYAKLIEKVPNYETMLGDDFAASECEPRLKLELLKKTQLDESLFDNMVEQIIIGQRSEQSPLIGLSAIYELMVKAQFDIEKLKNKLEHFSFENDEQNAAVASLFAFLVGVNHCYKQCEKCTSKPLEMVGGQ